MSEVEAGLVVEALGVRVQILAKGRILLDELRTTWHACETANRPADMVVDVCEPAGDAPPSLQLLERLTQEVTLKAVEAQAGHLLMLHACAIADPATGRAAIFVGPSGMGKTTLAASLGRRWDYVTDETAGITPGGVLLPYPKPLSVLEGGRAPKRQISPRQLGLNGRRDTSRPAAVFLLDRRPGLQRAFEEVVNVPPGIAMLAEHTSFIGRLDRPLSRLAELLHAGGGLRRLSYSASEHVFPVVDRVFAEAS